MVFGGAVLAHIESSHGGLGPVVRNIFDYRKARAAISAIDERIKMATILGIMEFIQAIWAGADIWGDGLEGIWDRL
jgi:hypothetical protein